MTIRTRLSIWYTGVLLASMLFLASAMYYELVIERRAVKAAGLKREPMGEEVTEIMMIYGFPTVLVTVGVGWWLLKRGLAPLSQLTRAAERLHADNLRERLPRTGRGDEVDRLSEVLNALTTRLDDSFKHIHEFTLHASHELKTPLSIMHGELEIALRDSSLAPARDTFVSQLNEIQRLTRIVDGLTLLTKADAGQVNLNCEPVRFDVLVKDGFTDAQMLALPRKLQIDLTACDEVTIHGDRHRLRQMLLNLADNAIKYNQPQGRVTLALSRNNGTTELRIANTGPGIPPEMITRVFDRFFRGESARRKEGDGCGLGLSIVKWIVNAHGGSIKIASQPGTLTTVTVSLPVWNGETAASTS